MRLFLQRFLLVLLSSFWFMACNNQQENGKVHANAVQEAKLAGKLLTGRVIGISDGDTFRMLLEGNKNIRVRLFGVDAPEKGQDYGTQARLALSDLIFRKEVQVIQKTKDRYGRVVGIAYAGITNINEALLKSGMVWHYTDFDKNPDWEALQINARKRGNGLWAKPGATPPWQWRKNKREENVEAD